MKIFHNHIEATLGEEQANPFCPLCGKKLFSIFGKDGYQILGIGFDHVYFCVLDLCFFYVDSGRFAMRKLTDGEWNFHLEKD